MDGPQSNTESGVSADNERRADRPLPVISGPRSKSVRQSRTSRWRAASLITVHLLIIAHVIQWLISGSTLSPVEPSEAMYTLNDGNLNAGFIFFVLAIAATAILGRFVCGWGCHLIAYQDLCAWLLRRAGIKPKPFRSRILVLAPLALAIYMFVWPSAYRFFVGVPRPPTTNHLITADFWATFPDLAVAIITVALCGFGIVYVLGAKGFCTYACPYGGFFALADQIAPGRIRVTDACEHCGHCTATCTSNVRVHEEVARYGMVVDPGCMKCMDCVSVCPNDALYFGFAKPSLGAQPAQPLRKAIYDYALWEELVMLGVGVAALLSYRGLYNQIPLLLAMGLAAMTGYLFVKWLRLIRVPHVRWQQLQLKRGGRFTKQGTFVFAGVALWIALTIHSGVIQYASWRGRSLIDSLSLGDDVWESDRTWSETTTPVQQEQLAAGLAYLERVDRWGLMTTPLALNKLVWAGLAHGDLDRAEAYLRRLAQINPDQSEPHRGLAWVMRKHGRIDEAVKSYETALALDPHNDRNRNELASLLIGQSRDDEAERVYRDGLRLAPNDVHWTVALTQLLSRQGRFVEAMGTVEGVIKSVPDSAALWSALGVVQLQAQQPEEGLTSLRRAVELDPTSAEAQYNLGYALLSHSRTTDALPLLRRAVELNDGVALWHYNLAVATFMSGDAGAALPHAQAATRLDPDDAQSWGFLAVVQESLGAATEAEESNRKARQLSGTDR